ncbi:MAG: DNA gyrase subunit A [Chitinivibrionales bacterium]|nr:DNA gyrase subunit A [Chitinivibrionales bacterium]
MNGNDNRPTQDKIEPRPRLIPVFIEDEMQKSYLDYSMSMITSRALPDVRDGLKPVHRRVLYGMEDLGLRHNRPTKKCANVVGNVMAKYHPHGDMPIYDTLVRMAQDFSMRYRMVEGQGNFGSIDGDPPAAYRYTECRMTAMAEEMLADIDKETVDFAPNYDDTTQEPSVLPAKIPSLLVNGATGIAVGMATNMAPHNLGEVVDATVAVIDNPDIELSELISHLPGPDFPTGGIIYGRSGILEAYRTGRGKVVMRARADIEPASGDRHLIVVTEIPYMVNKTTLLEKMADLVRQKTIEGISFIRDESDRSGLRIVVGVKKDAYPEVVLNKLYKYTQLQSTFAINSLALVNMKPKLLNLRQIIDYFIEHRLEVVTRRTTFDLNKAKDRAHILEGLRIALDHIDEIVELIKSSASPDEAAAKLMERFNLSERQTQAILDMRLQRLTGLERDKIEQEYRELQETIAELTAILESVERRMAIIKDELLDLKRRFGDPRRTEITETEADVDIEDMIADEDMLITMTHSGYIKRTAVATYRAQGRGGKGIKGMESKDGDFIQSMFAASAHSNLLFFTNTGRCYTVKVYRLPEAGRQSRGRPIVNVLQLRPEESVAACVPVREFDDTHFIVAASERGVINKQPLKAYANVRRDGINAFNLDDGDRLIEVKLTDGTADIILATRLGQAVRFPESAVRELGRNTRGVRGITLRGDDQVVGMVIIDDSNRILTVTSKGYGKRTEVAEYRRTNRGGSGIINIRLTERNGEVVVVRRVSDESDAMLITQQGIVIRTEVSSISIIGRNAQGVRLMNLGEGDRVIDCAIVDKEEEDEGEQTEGATDDAGQSADDGALSATEADGGEPIDEGGTESDSSDGEAASEPEDQQGQE